MLSSTSSTTSDGDNRLPEKRPERLPRRMTASGDLPSGVTRVGDTRGGNWGCRPSIFSWKTWRLFCSSLTLTIAFYCFHSGVTPPGCHPTPFLPVRPRFSAILCKFAHNFFPSGVTPWGCLPARFAPPHSDATALPRACCIISRPSLATTTARQIADIPCDRMIHGPWHEPIAYLTGWRDDAIDMSTQRQVTRYIDWNLTRYYRA